MNSFEGSLERESNLEKKKRIIKEVASELKKEFGSRVIFHGGVDNQAVLPRGAVDDVRRETRDCLATLGAGREGFVMGEEFQEDGRAHQNGGVAVNAMAIRHGRSPQK